MAKARATQGTVGQFTYDFGVQIAKGTVREVTRLAGVSLTLASAFYTLKNTAQEYLDVVTKNNLRMGGIVQAMREYENANKRLVKGLTYSSPKQQIEGMNELMAAGIDVEKNFEWISKSAHAMGKSFDEFAGAIANGIHGNMSALVDMGLMTQRSTRAFQKYTADTVQRQQAILRFVQTHKGLQAAIKDDFVRISDEMNRIKAAWNGFVRSIIGDPKSPSSFYGQIRNAVKEVADAVARNYESIKKYAQGIGLVLGWVAKQVGHAVHWLGRQAKMIATDLLGSAEEFGNAMRSFVVWLEFWKVHIIKTLKPVYQWLVKHKELVYSIIKVYLALKAINWVWGIGSAAITSVGKYAGAIAHAFKLQKRYYLLMRKSGMTVIGSWLQSLASFMPRWFRRIWVALGKWVATVGEMGIVKYLKYIFRMVGKWFGRIGGLFKGWFGRLGSWIIRVVSKFGVWGIIIAAIIAVVTFLYKKIEGVRVIINSTVTWILELFKLIWNALMWAYVRIVVGLRKVWGGIKDLFHWIRDVFVSFGNWISDMWNRFMDTRIGRFIDKYLVQPLQKVLGIFKQMWDAVVGFFRGLGRLWGANDALSANVQEYAQAHGVNVKTFGTGTYDLGADYLSAEGWRNLGNNSSSSASLPATPTLPSMPTSAAAASVAGTSTMTVQSGAVQIIVQGGENIDEQVLAERVRNVLNDMQRENEMRGGRSNSHSFTW